MVRGTCGAFRGAGRAGLSTWRAGRVGKVYMEEGLFREFYVESGASCKGRGVHRRPPPTPRPLLFLATPQKGWGLPEQGLNLGYLVGVSFGARASPTCGVVAVLPNL